MSNIVLPDEYEGFYAAHKQMHPDDLIVLKQFERRKVEQVDAIVRLAHGERDLVSTESDWKVVEEIIKFFANEWPQEYREFKEVMPEIKQAKGEGYSQSREILHVGSVPPRLMKMIKAIFPSQQWDKKFTSKLVKKFPLFRVGESLNKKMTFFG